MNSRPRPRYSDLYLGIGAIKGLSLQERAMLWKLATFADPDGSNIYPSHKTLARELEIAESSVRRLIASLRKKNHLVSERRKGYCMQYRLNIPGITPVVVTLSEADQTDISKEDWESQFLTDEELQAQGVQLPGQPPPPEEEDLGGPLEDELEETQPRLPAVKPPAAPTMALVPVTPVVRLPATYQPPGPTPEEKLQRDMEVLKETLDLVARGICTYDQFMRGGRRKGFSDDFLNWMFTGGMSDPSNGSQPYNESDLITNLQERRYSTIEGIVT